MRRDEDIHYMKMAVSLAGKGAGHVSPNPMVGAVIVKDDRVISRGWHKVFGGLHAETDALASCAESPAGATMYVTLEPCCHYGKQPPCTSAIIKAGISRVVVGMTDPNPLVGGKGISILRGTRHRSVHRPSGKRNTVSEQDFPEIHYTAQAMDRAEMGHDA